MHFVSFVQKLNILANKSKTIAMQTSWKNLAYLEYKHVLSQVAPSVGHSTTIHQMRYMAFNLLEFLSNK